MKKNGRKDFYGTNFFAGHKSKGGIIHVANIKGGVGKSTVATNLAAALAKNGNTLIIDFDVQGNVSHAFGFMGKKGGSSLLLNKRYSEFLDLTPSKTSFVYQAFLFFKKIEHAIFGIIIGHGDISVLCGQVEENLWMIQADDSLWGDANFFKRQNLANNLQLLLKRFKYIVLDTPSIWNNLSKFLYVHSDLNLIPVTLNALSTRSLRDYLVHIARMSQFHPDITVRIVKNEVFGSQKDEEDPINLRGKMRTMSKNRTFLNNLCQSLRFYKNGKTVAPEQIMFDIEIPESSIICNAQDMGISVEEYKAKSLVAQSFASLADMVTTTLNSSRRKKRKYGVGTAQLLIFAAFVLGYLEYSIRYDPVILSYPPPKAVIPEQAKVSESKIIRRTFKEDDNIYRIAKHAISKFVGIVPTMHELDAYINEMINIHNSTNPKENYIKNADDILTGQTIEFYPSSVLQNSANKEMTPVYNYFMDLVADPRPYITDDWQKRGYAGDGRHNGIDVAGILGSNVKTPISGIVVNKDTQTDGRITGVVSRADGTVVFFAHLDERYFNTGDSVSVATAIGTVGATGRAGSPRVHIGFGVKTLEPSGMAFGKYRYKETDPKFLYYRQVYNDNGRR